jgi:IMP dehydrogenase
METYDLENLLSLSAAEVMSAPAAIVRTGSSAWEAVERFLAGPARHIVVVDSGDRCVGILSTRHLAGLWPFDPKQLKSTSVETLGCVPWIAVRPADDLRTCARTLTEHRLDAVPVLDNQDRVVGVVTARDITRALADVPERILSNHAAYQR